MRLVILDNGFPDTGHHRHMGVHMVPEARALGHETVLLAHRSVPPDLRQAVDAIPAFTTFFYTPLGPDPFKAFGRLQGYLKDLTSNLPLLSVGDLLFLPTTSVLELFAVLHWIGQRDYGLKFGFLFHNTDFPRMDARLSDYLWGASRDLLAGLPGPDRIRLMATNPRLCDDLEARLGRPVALAGSRTWYDGEPTPGDEPTGPVRVGFLGGLRPAKGALRMPGLIRALRAAHPDWTVVVQCAADSPLAPSFDVFEGDPGVERIDRFLDDAELAETLVGLDVLILPYDRAVYADCGSGLLNLAAGWGVPVVAPDGTTMATFLAGPQSPLGTTYSGDDDADIIDAVARVVADRHRNRLEGPAAARRWREAHSGSAMLRDLLAWGRGEV